MIGGGAFLFLLSALWGVLFFVFFFLKHGGWLMWVLNTKCSDFAID
jgi:hypothetical protein